MHSRASWSLQAMQERSADMGLGGVDPSGCLVAGEMGVIPSGVSEMSECVPLSSWVPSRREKALNSLPCSTAHCHWWQLLQRQQIGLYQTDAL